MECSLHGLINIMAREQYCSSVTPWVGLVFRVLVDIIRTFLTSELMVYPVSTILYTIDAIVFRHISYLFISPETIHIIYSISLN